MTERTPTHQDTVHHCVSHAFRQTARTAIPGNLFAATLALVPLWNAVPHHLLLAWFVLFVAICAGRLALTVQFRRVATVETASRWALLHRTSSLVAGGAWGLTACAVPALPEVEKLFLLTIIAGIVAGGLAVNASLRASFVAFSLAAMLPPAGMVLATEGTTNQVVGLAALVFPLFLLPVARSLETSFRSSHELAAQQGELLRRLEHNSAELKAANESLERKIEEQRASELQLLKAKIAAEQSLRGHKEQIAGLGEELREPVARLRHALMVLSSQCRTDATADEAVHARNACEQMSALSEALTLVSDAPEPDGVCDQTDEVTIPALVGEVRDLLSPLAEALGVDLRLTSDASGPERRMPDCRRLRSVLFTAGYLGIRTSLTKNVHIRVAQSTSMDGTDRIRWTVSDAEGPAEQPEDETWDGSEALAIPTRKGPSVARLVLEMLVTSMEGRLSEDASSAEARLLAVDLPLMTSNPAGPAPA